MDSYNSELYLYQEALSCLQTAAEECHKSSNVDITRMLQNCAKCAEFAKNLQTLETNPARQAGLAELIASLSCHQEILTAKIHQLNRDPVYQPGEPVFVSSEAITEPEQMSSDVRGGSDSETDHQRSKLEDAIRATIVPESSVDFSSVIGLEEAKQSLREAIILPSLHPHLFTGGRQPWRRILLYGPPGTGKSYLAKAVSMEIKSTFYCVSSSDLLSSWFGESEKLIKELFRHATKQPGTSVVFIDEVDSICRQRSSREEESTRRIKNELLSQMEGASSASSLFLLCATNCPWELDTAFLRRFQKRIHITLPDEAARLSQLQMHCKGTPVALSPGEWSELVKMTTGYSGSDISNLVLGALFEPVRHMQVATVWRHTTDGHVKPSSSDEPGSFPSKMSDLPHNKVQPRDVSIEDFLASLKSHSKTINYTELEKYEEFTKAYGQIG